MKEIKFDISEEKLLDIANTKFKDGDLRATLRLLHKKIELYDVDTETLARLADCYEVLELFEQAAEYWMHYLDICDVDEEYEAFEGLMVCMLKLNNDKASSYYNTRVADLMDTSVTSKLQDEFLEHEYQQRRSKISIVWPKESQDFSEELAKGVKLLKAGHIKKAKDVFHTIPEGSSYQLTALNYLTVVNLLDGYLDVAEENCKKALQIDAYNVVALTNYAAILHEQNKDDESKAITKQLLQVHTDEKEELYKIAIICCENGFYAEAFERFQQLENNGELDHILLNFKAVAAFMCNKIDVSLHEFSKLIDYYPHAYIARYFYKQIAEYKKGNIEKPNINFYYKLPEPEREKQLDLLLSILENKDGDKITLSDNQFEELFYWPFDENSEVTGQLQMIAIAVASKLKKFGHLKHLLYKMKINDEYKIEILRQMALHNQGFEAGVNANGIFTKVSFQPLKIAKKRKKYFIQAQALLFSRFAILGQYSILFNSTLQSIYSNLANLENLELIDNAKDLACVAFIICLKADKEQVERHIQFFDSNAEKVNKILSCLDATQQLQEVAITEDNGESYAAD